MVFSSHANQPPVCCRNIRPPELTSSLITGNVVGVNAYAGNPPNRIGTPLSQAFPPLMVHTPSCVCRLPVLVIDVPSADGANGNWTAAGSRVVSEIVGGVVSAPPPTTFCPTLFQA